MIVSLENDLKSCCKAVSRDRGISKPFERMVQNCDSQLTVAYVIGCLIDLPLSQK
jgi:hypothetical protein